MTNTLPLAGKGVFLTRATRFSYGHKAGWKVFTEYDGAASVRFEEFWELEAMLKAGGHVAPNRSHNSITDLPHIMAELEQHENSYRVAFIIASDGITKVTRKQVQDEQKAKREEMNSRMEQYSGLKISERFAKAASIKAQAKRDAMNARFAHGETLHAYQRTNEFYLLEVAGEYQLRQRIVEVAA